MGITQDLGQSWLWFSLAAQQGDADAAKKRDEVAAKMDAKALADIAPALANFHATAPNPRPTTCRAASPGGPAGTSPKSVAEARPRSRSRKSGANPASHTVVRH